jgi:hypothetical protein
MAEFSDAEKAIEAALEVTMRERVYPKMIRLGKMSQSDANRKIKLMREIALDYQEKGRRLLFDRYDDASEGR